MRTQWPTFRPWIQLVFLTGVGMFLSAAPATAQFSPGDLSRAHHSLEGSQNCVKCHDVGQEISGVKCLACHGEIKEMLDAKRGFHGRVAAERCVTCHKEHLGINAKTTNFDAKTFDHAKTGFLLDGKHERAACEKCHNARNIVNKSVMKSLDAVPRQTFLGLDTKCATCHDDVHKGKFQQNCVQCHSTSGWKGVKNFDHSKSRFPLEGKHVQVACAKCHPSMGSRPAKGALDFATVGFTDCTPCHKSPHKQQFSDQRCSSCHTVQEWQEAMKRPFEHSKTSYPLKGRHAQIECAACHRVADRQPFAKTFLLPFGRCIDCHTDKHNGEFTKKYKNDCAECHTVERFKPSTFTLARHAESRFALTGAHTAIVCSGCHAKADRPTGTFQFASLRCDNCHKDVHKGQFTERMKDASCAACHTTERWTNARFDHSTTSFPLNGKHANVSCAACHKDGAVNGATLQYKKIATTCASCHKDVHQGQFARDNTTTCESCHSSVGWRTLLFDHETQSSFRLTGAHKNVPCRACHRNESIGAVSFTRFKPISGECASCHAKGGGQ